MNRIEDLFQERLEQLQNGEPLEDCGAGLPEQEAQLLALAAKLRELDYPQPNQETVATQRAEVMRQARARGRPKALPRSRRTVSRSLPRWTVPAVAFAVPVLLLFACSVLFVAGAKSWWLRTREMEMPQEVAAGFTPETQPIAGTATHTPASTGVAPQVVPEAAPLQAPDAESAALGKVQGLVQVRGADGEWATVRERVRVVQAGDLVRTGALSSAVLAFYDGSLARLGPNSELGIDELDARASGGPRVILLSLRSGESDHDVIPSKVQGAQYAVTTPLGSGAARGTRFRVRIASPQAYFSVDEGAIDVSHLDATVVVAAGQASVVSAELPPSEPFFRVTGEGELQEIGSSYRIAEQVFETHEGTVIVGNPQVGDWVRVEGRLLPDSTQVADLIVLLRRSPESRFTLRGSVETITETEWTVAGQALLVDETTQIEAGIVVGDQVRVEGLLLASGEWLAERILRPAEDAPGLPFEIVGVVQETGDAVWTISGLSISVDAETELEEGLEVGDLVRVEGWILPDGIWLAHEMRREGEADRPFEFAGPLESIAPWIVSGITLETGPGTVIDAEVEVGSIVHVEGRILEDGTWMASEIALLDQAWSGVELVGQVEGTEPWVVSGVTLAVDGETEIEGEIEVGDWVRVRAQVLPDGTWLAREIRPYDAGQRGGCVWFGAIVVSVDAQQIVLDNQLVVPLDLGVQIEGQVEVGSVVAVQVCVSDEDTRTVVRVIILHPYEEEPPGTPVPGTPTPDAQPEALKVTICHKPGTPAEQTKLIPESAVGGHLGHGDYLGPCGESDETQKHKRGKKQKDGD
jgi:hypothetical protein